MNRRGTIKKQYVLFFLLIVLLAISVIALSSVTLNAPANNAYIRSTYLLNATTDVTADNATFYYSNASVFYEIGTNTTNGTTFTFSWDTSAISDGAYNVTVNATNASGTVVTDKNLNIVVDNTNPVIALDAPATNSWDADGSVTFQYTPTDTNLGTCIIYGNFSTSWAAN
ncbi:hypothetical protein KY361_04485, partial [Candidatus Woesearchaeota archaeon]|nr:hypothetical protein [Candidatus Woesearchaeota archaeon]